MGEKPHPPKKMTIDPTKEYHTRSPDYEAEIWKIADGRIWGRLRHRNYLYTKPEWEIWRPASWRLDGLSNDYEYVEEGTDLIQEPEKEVIVWENIMYLEGYTYLGQSPEKCRFKKTFIKPITLKITTIDGVTKVETV